MPPGAIPIDTRPRTLPYTEGEPIPPGYVVESKVRKGMVIPGAILLGAPYVLGLSIAALTDFDNQSGWLAVPIAGPWITLAARRKCHDDSFGNCTDTADRALDIYLVFDGLIQTAGAALLVAGMAAKKTELVRMDTVSVRFMPGPIGRDGYGGHVFGTF